MIILKIFKQELFWLILLLIIGFALRFWRIDSPIADWHSWRQADTASVTRNFIKEGFNPLIPKYDDMSGVADDPTPNPSRFRFVEFPIYNIFVYPFYLFFGIRVEYHRLVSILFSLASIVLLYAIVKEYSGKLAAFLSAFSFAVLPFNVFFSRTTLPEPTFIFFGLGMIYFVSQWLKKDKLIYLALGFIFTSTAFLMKPWALFFYLPLLYLVKNKKNMLKFLIFSAISITPFIIWRLWMLQQPEGIPASSWLLNGDSIRFRPAFWWWLISERIGREILGATGIVLFFIGIISKPKNGNYFLHFWALSSFLFMIVFATGNVRHNYYQILFVPVACIFLSAGFIQFLKGSDLFVARIWTILLALLFFPLSFYFGFMQIKGFYQINNPVIVEVGKIADKILPENAIVVASYNGDTAFLYQINRPGFAFDPLPLKELIADYGVNYYVSTNYDNRTNWILGHFYPIEKSPKFVIVDLTKLKAPFNQIDPEP